MSGTEAAGGLGQGQGTGETPREEAEMHVM
jgi:hypothetical protein